VSNSTSSTAVTGHLHVDEGDVEALDRFGGH
jgi:hypothetical protein